MTVARVPVRLRHQTWIHALGGGFTGRMELVDVGTGAAVLWYSSALERVSICHNWSEGESTSSVGRR
jgi:hypothetical protein